MIIFNNNNDNNKNKEDIHTICCNDENVEKLPKNIYENLEVLVYSFTKLSVLNRINTYTNVTNLNLSHNNISFIPKQISQLKCVRTINLSFNKIDVIPDFFYKLNSLSYLDISDNRIVYIKGKITKLSNLNVLDLSNNRIIDIKIRKYMNVRYLNISNNLLFSYEFLNYMLELINLKMEKLYIVIIPEEINNLIKLKKLSLYNNPINDI